MLKWPILLFDFDGTLVSTEELAQEAVLSYFDDKKLTSLRPFSTQIIGRTWKAAAEIVFAEANARGIKIDSPQELIHDWKVRYRKQFQSGVKLIPGVVAKLEALKSERAIMGIVTGSDADEVHTILKHYDLAKYFKNIWSSGDYAHSKPHPSPYLKAMGDLKAEPEKIMVFEDSLVGCESAFQAGLKWIQVLHCSYTKPDPRSYKQIADWDKLEISWLLK